MIILDPFRVFFVNFGLWDFVFFLIWTRFALSEPNNSGQNKNGVFKKCEIATLGGFRENTTKNGDTKKCQNLVEMGLEKSI